MNLSKMKYQEELSLKFGEILSLCDEFPNDMEFGLAVRSLIKKYKVSNVETLDIKFPQPEDRKDSPHHHENRLD